MRGSAGSRLAPGVDGATVGNSPAGFVGVVPETGSDSGGIVGSVVVGGTVPEGGGLLVSLGAVAVGVGVGEGVGEGVAATSTVAAERGETVLAEIARPVSLTGSPAVALPPTLTVACSSSV